MAVDQVGLRGLEPRTSSLSGMRSNHLSYKPILMKKSSNHKFSKKHYPQKWYFKYSMRRSCRLPVRPLSNRFEILLKKEVIQPHLPVRLPCYDFAPVTSLTLTSSLPKVRPPDSGTTDFHGVTGGVYKTRERIHRGVLIHDY